MGESTAQPRTGIRVHGLVKTYGETIALDGLDLEVSPGEVVGIAGPNGAGKSTLIKILAGEVSADAGEVFIDDVPWSAATHSRAVAVVHQEPELFGNLSVAENLMVGREGSKIWMRPPGSTEVDLLDDLGIANYANKRLEATPLAVQQKVEIGRALIDEVRVVLFDEPNSALTEEESDELFRRIHRLADQGHVVLLVSHRLAELAEHADRVVVIIDGKVSVQLKDDEISKERIAQELVVGALESARAERLERQVPLADEPVILHLRDWTVKGSRIAGVEVSLRARQVTAFIGVEGSGARELVQSFAGVTAGHGEALVGDPHSRATSGSAFVAASRASSLFENLSVGENLIIRLDKEISGPFGYFDHRKARQLSEAGRTDLLVKAASVKQPIRDLSGGNQQKVAIGSALMTRPSLLVLEEPTRGVDIGSKAQIYSQLADFAREGNAVAIFCTEDIEVFEAADVVHVVANGQTSEPIEVNGFSTVRALASALVRVQHDIASSSKKENTSDESD